ncbi:riboflavin kinase KNAG_0A04220 [Huiozyma naganishii CBS 8797]|uniref:Riboflavin kinase n=1 Tax=Huiozyma naganishii (strain ATCC MYA-139 / BCRC 22969 / CBS 8797 / KCTC 17520 / NBRC 10181 / NCYC 3082 / Yp74L-3) TaxID=1071383 RepID=J7S2D1_HUIN7|nr:hypothetical protein KNAG_0A04220 [Kazachstania naganishii CBS 8797]CCK68099.1 hypothetical protein KNAG_0A04220 [Kazachstania naganishii CBS 8797]
MKLLLLRSFEFGLYLCTVLTVLQIIRTPSENNHRYAMTLRSFDKPIPETPQPPFPIVTDQYCTIVCGFGRGSSELGIPTANVAVEDLPPIVNKLDLGVYFGFAHLRPVLDRDVELVKRKDGQEVTYNYGKYLLEENGDFEVLPVVLSIGKNPFYGNNYKTVELHILHEFENNFYGAQVKFNLLGYIRPELNYTTVDALIHDINTDIGISKSTLAKPEYKRFERQVSDDSN